MKEGPESLISAPLLDQVVASLAVGMHHIQGILLAVVHNLSRGVNFRRMHLKALRLIGSTTTRWRDLRVRSTYGVSGSDSDAAATVKAEALTGAPSRLGRVMTSTAAATTSSMATSDFSWLLRGMVERRSERGWTTPNKQRRRGSP
jgi:hypothetical protein